MLGPKLAIVLRAKSGDNLLLQTHGIPGKVVQEAATDALETLGRFSKDGAKAGLRDGSGNAVPDFALGQVSALQGKYLVTYRLVNAIIVLLISEATTNAFLCLRTLDAATKILIAACKGTEVTSDRLSKRYADVHAFLGDIIAGGVSSLPPSFIHTSATDERLLAVPLSAADAARRLRKLVGSGGKQSTFVPGKQSDTTDPTPPPLPETPTRKDGRHRFSADASDPLRAIEFAIPSDALPPPPARAVGAKRKPPAPPREILMVAPVAFKGAVEDDTEKKPPDAAEGFGAFEEVKLLEATKDEGQLKETDGEWSAEFTQEKKDSPAGPTIDDLKQALQLVEIYRGQVTGTALIKAGIEGRVCRRLAPYGLTSAKYRMTKSDRLVVNACLQTASRNKLYSFPATTSHDTNDTINPASSTTTTTNNTSMSELYSFYAKLSGVPMDCSYFKYTLPAVACNPPLQLELITAPQTEMHIPGKPARVQWEGLVMLRYAVDPCLPGALLDVVIDIDLAPELAKLVKISPAGRWSFEECRLRWSLGSIDTGASGCVRAVVGAKEGTTPARAEEVLRSGTTAKVLFTGSPGYSLSGIGFEVAMHDSDQQNNDMMIVDVDDDDKEREKKSFHRGRIVNFGEIVVKP